MPDRSRRSERKRLVQQGVEGGLARFRRTLTIYLRSGALGKCAPIAAFGHGLQRTIEERLVALEQGMGNVVPPVQIVKLSRWS